MKHIGNFREGVEGEIKIHQAATQFRIIYAKGIERKVQGIASHLPEIRVQSLQRPEPGILKLLFAPKSGKPLKLIPKYIATTIGGGGVIEKGSIGIEDARARSL